MPNAPVSLASKASPTSKNILPAPTPHCTVVDTLDVIGGKWKVLIIYHLHHPDNTPKRFNELRRCLPDITQRMMTLQLKDLVRDGIIIRHNYQEVPPKVEYSLSEQGLTLVPVLNAMSAWGEMHAHKCLQHRQTFDTQADSTFVDE